MNLKIKTAISLFLNACVEAQQKLYICGFLYLSPSSTPMGAHECVLLQKLKDLNSLFYTACVIFMQIYIYRRGNRKKNFETIGPVRLVSLLFNAEKS